MFFAKIVDIQLCSLCNSENETISHLFFECLYAQALWYEVRNILINAGYHLNVFTISDIMFCMIDEMPVINHIIICTKYFIYKKSMISAKPEVNRLIQVLKYYYKIEKEIGYKNRTLSKFYEKWSFLSRLLE